MGFSLSHLPKIYYKFLAFDVDGDLLDRRASTIAHKNVVVSDLRLVLASGGRERGNVGRWNIGAVNENGDVSSWW